MAMSGVLTITLNPSIDLYTQVDKLAPARKLRCAAERRDPGGGGLNVARVMHRMGGDVLAAFPCGGLAGQMLDRLLRAEGLNRLALPARGDVRENVTVLETASNEEYRFILPGPHFGPEDWRQILSRIEALPEQWDWLVLSGSLPPGAPADAYAQLARLGRARGARIAVDASGAALRAALSERVGLVKPNLDELRELTGRPLKDLPSRVEAARQLARSGAAEIVLLSMGGEGALLATADGAWRAPAIAIDPVSTIGAGDSFVGAMLWALTADRSLEAAFRYAVAAGAAALLTPGTDLCMRQDVERLHARVELAAL